MPTIYISDRGDDKNDGLSLQTAVYSLKRAQKLQGGKNDCSWHFGPRAWERIKKELADKEKRRSVRSIERGRQLTTVEQMRLANDNLDPYRFMPPKPRWCWLSALL